MTEMVADNFNQEQKQRARISELLSYLQIDFNERSRNVLRKIRKQIKQFHCIKRPIEKHNCKQAININTLKSDNRIMINIMAMYSHTTRHLKGQILDATGQNKQSIKILLKGKVAAFQPINKSSYSACKQNDNAHLMKVQQSNHFIQALCQEQRKLQIQRKREELEEQQQSIAKEKNQISLLRLDDSDGMRQTFQRRKQDQNNKQYNECMGTPKFKCQFDTKINPPSIQSENMSSLHDLKNQVKNLYQKESHNQDISSEQLLVNQCLSILALARIVTQSTMHRFSHIISGFSHLVSSARNPYLIQQQQQRNDFSSVCLTDCLVMELDFKIFKEILILMDHYQEASFIQCLQKKFEHMSSIEAREYIKQRNMINYKKQDKKQIYKNVVTQIYGQSELLKVEKYQRKYKESQENEGQHLDKKEQEYCKKDEQPQNLQKQSDQPLDQDSLDDYEEEFQEEDAQLSQSKADIKLFSQNFEKAYTEFLKEDTSSLQFYQIKYSKQVYIIVSGEVRIKIDKSSENPILNKKDALKHAAVRKNLQPKELLKLYSNDIFGFEQIGKDKSYNLRYEIRRDSKLLKLESSTIQNHFDTINGFKNQIQLIQERRNTLLSEIIKNVSFKRKKSFKDRYYTPTLAVYQHNKKQQRLNPLPQKIPSVQQVLKGRSKSEKRMFNSQKEEGRVGKNRKISLVSLLDKERQFNDQLYNTNSHQDQQLKRQISTKKMEKTANILSSLPFQDKTQLQSIEYASCNTDHIQKKLFEGKLMLQKKNAQYNKRLSLDLLQQFGAVTLMDQYTKLKSSNKTNQINENNSGENPEIVKMTYIQMRDPKGNLIRKKSLPKIDGHVNNRNIKILQNVIIKKIGLLSQGEKVQQNLRISKNRKSKIQCQDINKQKRQFDRLKKMARSVPKLEKFYSKKCQKEFNLLSKNKNLIY